MVPTTKSTISMENNWRVSLPMLTGVDMPLTTMNHMVLVHWPKVRGRKAAGLGKSFEDWRERMVTECYDNAHPTMLLHIA